MPASTAGYKVTSAGASPRVRVASRHTTYTLLRIDFGKRLAAGATRTFAIGFDIVDKGGAPTRPLRIGASLVTFSAWGLGSDGATGGSVTVVFPKGYAIQPSGAGLGKPTTDAAGNTVFTTGRLANPLKFFAYFVGRPPGRLQGDDVPASRSTATRSRSRSAPGRTTRRGRSGSGACSRRACRRSRRRSGCRGRSTGRWSSRRRSAGTRAASPAGSTRPSRHDRDRLLRRRVRRSSTRPPTPGSTAASSPTAGRARGSPRGTRSRPRRRSARRRSRGDPLTAGPREAPRCRSTPGARPRPTRRRPVGGRRVRRRPRAREPDRRAGRRGRAAAVWQAIRDQRAAYQPTGAGAALERTTGAPDWRGLLDLLEDRTGRSYDDLWTAWVLRPNEADLLDRPRRGPGRLPDVADRAATWQMPRVVRDALRVVAVRAGRAICSNAASRALDDRDARAGRRRGRRADAAADDAGRRSRAARVRRRVRRGRRRARGDRRLPRRGVVAARRARRPAGARPVGADPDAVPGARARRRSRAATSRRRVRASAFARSIWDSADDDRPQPRPGGRPASLAAILLGGWLARPLDARPRRPAPPDPAPRRLTTPAMTAPARAVHGATSGSPSSRSLLGVAGALAPRDARRSPRAATDGLRSAPRPRRTRSSRPASVVRVVVDVTARNDKPNLVSGGVRTRYFYDGFRIGIQPEARLDPGDRRRRDRCGDDDPAAGRLLELEVRFPSSLFYHQVAKVRVTFDLPGGAPRSKSEVRVGPAFATFAAWAFGEFGSRPDRRPGRLRGRDERLRRRPLDQRSGTVFTAATRHRRPVVGRDRQRRPPVGPHERPDRPAGRRAPRRPRLARRPVVAARRHASSSRPACPKLVEETGPPLAGVGRPRRLRGPHAAARGLRRDLLRGREPDRDQRGPRRPDDPPRGVARLVQRRAVRRALDQRGLRRHVSRRGRSTRSGCGGWTPNARSTRPTRRPCGSTTGRSRAGSRTTQTDAREAYGYDAAWTVVRSIAASSGRTGCGRCSRPPRPARSPTPARARPRR